MTPRPNTFVAPEGEDIFKIWKKVRKYIDDEDVLYDFDADMDEFDEDDAEEFFHDKVIDYLNEEIAPPGTLFGINAETGEIGFWEEELVDGIDEVDDRDFNPDLEDYDDEEDLPLEEEGPSESGIRAEEDFQPRTEEEEFRPRTPSERIDEILAEAEAAEEDEVGEEGSQESGIGESGKKSGVAEVLDEEGEVVAETKFTKNPDIDIDYMMKHLRKYAEHTVDPDDFDDFMEFATAEVKEDPEYWSTGSWRQMYDRFLDKKYGEK